MSRSGVRHKPLAEATPESAVDALSSVYCFILDCHVKRKAAEPTPEPDSYNTRGVSENDSRATGILPE
jgi:hypothetical protein